MPLRFNKVERDEWRSRMAGKSHTCEACCAGNCKDCSGTCDCSDCHGTKDASVLDALESKTAAFPPDLQEGDLHPDYPPEDDYLESEGGQCPMCGGSSTMLGQLGNRVHYRCRNCGMDHSSEGHGREPDEYEEIPSVGDNANFHAHVTFKQSAPIFNEPFIPHAEQAAQAAPHLQAPAAESGWGALQPCRNCGHAMQTFQGQHGAMCPNCGHEEGIMAQAKTADASMPPESVPYQQKETALPYNPEAYESGVADMHPAAQYTYQRAVAQGADPQSAYQAAQEKQGEMGKRTQEGQNTEGVQIPVINTSYHGDQTGFVSSATIKRISHLIP